VRAVLRLRDVIGLVIALGVAGTCVRLGLWQLQRLQQRRANVALIRAARALPPVEVTSARVSPDAVRDRRVHLNGRYDFSHERVWPGRAFEEVPGVALLTPLRLPDGSAVFVDRGFAPAPDAMHVRKEDFREPDSADVTGLALRAPRGRGDVDPAQLTDSIPYPLASWVVLQVAQPGTASPRIFRWTPDPLDYGPHLLYAIQWFSFATIVIVGTLFLVRRTVLDRQTLPQGDH